MPLARQISGAFSRPKACSMKNESVAPLLYPALDTERRGARLYETALKCVVNADLEMEWEEYLEQTNNHARMRLDTMGD